ncbi:DUF3667 domain-containing protein [Polaribacter cellanae]|uniref:DUF3667 domain-containing protein n=1 Tax=Polaribacter cellanae TaxID=2818493 RepID=A0A975H8X8_9FLAO|nr:DUF3667 domain-containing protein [Polaribacter cellanae]QTE22155.1 DUF3667 domain-containing protein [Polaribacter cellanae]
MNCKNCQDPLEENALFCDNCGAKVVTSRITFKHLVTELAIDVFGIDSKFFLTLRKMVTNPEEVIGEYLSGVRKKYVNPFAFLAVGAALSVIIFNYFSDDFINIQNAMNSENLTEIREKATVDISAFPNLNEKELEKLKIEKKVAEFQLSTMDKIWYFMLRYFNLLAFLFLVIYAVLSKWTYRKPHNFGEHIVINAYIYGFATYFTLIAFLAAIVIHPSIYLYSTLTYILYYLYAFGKLYKLSFGKNILKLLRFLIGLILLFVISLILAGLIGYVLGKLGFFNL